MDFSFSEEQEMLRKMARDFLTTECPKDFVRQMVKDETGYTPDLWQKMADLGWMGLIIPEEYGGTGNSFLDAVALVEETGRACLPGPFFSTLVGTMALLNFGNAEQKKEILPKVAEGKCILTAAFAEPGVGYEYQAMRCQATFRDEQWVLKGTKLFVENAHVANYAIVAVKSKEANWRKGISLFLVDMTDPDILKTPITSIGGEKMFEVTFKNLRVSPGNVLGKLHEAEPDIRRLLKWAVLLKCAEMVGGAEQVMELTSEFTKQRVQFDHPIGSLQAIQHHCANMKIDLEGMKYITYLASWRLHEGIPNNKESAMAKVWAGDAYLRICDTAHQVHGAIGFCEDHDLPLYTKKAKASDFAFGDSQFQRRYVARAIGL